MFELTKAEWNEPVTICDQIPEAMKHSYIPPFAFTEHGVTRKYLPMREYML